MRIEGGFEGDLGEIVVKKEEVRKVVWILNQPRDLILSRYLKRQNMQYIPSSALGFVEGSSYRLHVSLFGRGETWHVASLRAVFLIRSIL